MTFDDCADAERTHHRPRAGPLRVAALANASIVNFTNVANDAQTPRTTVYEYFGILRDTLVLVEVPAWRQSVKRKPLASSKYYFFDIGVASALQGRRPRPGTPEFGQAFETWLLHELRSWIDYRSGEELRYWRCTSGFEVDFILGDHTAIEVKGKANVAAARAQELDRLPLGRRAALLALHVGLRRVGWAPSGAEGDDGRARSRSRFTAPDSPRDVGSNDAPS